MDYHRNYAEEMSFPHWLDIAIPLRFNNHALGKSILRVWLPSFEQRLYFIDRTANTFWEQKHTQMILEKLHSGFEWQKPTILCSVT